MGDLDMGPKRAASVNGILGNHLLLQNTRC
jgi:hypothetical protein